MAEKRNPVVHFEMPYIDKKRVAEFYAKTFGWKAKMMGPEMGNYIVAETSEMDEKTHFPKEPGRINGGFFKKDDVKPGFQYTSVVIAVENIQEAMKKVKESGGKVIGGQKPGVPDKIPGVGLYISIMDTEGNRVGMLQPEGM